MGGVECGLLFFVFVMIALFVRLAAGSMDGDRVKSYIEQQGGILLESHWSPFGKGWYGEKDSRIYEVRYRDREGNIHSATIKTSMFSGVYFTDDEIVSRANVKMPVDVQLDPSLLEDENQRLRERIAELEGRADSGASP